MVLDFWFKVFALSDFQDMMIKKFKKPLPAKNGNSSSL